MNMFHIIILDVVTDFAKFVFTREMVENETLLTEVASKTMTY